MAIYHLRVKIGRRTVETRNGPVRRSAVAAAAYRSGERLSDQLLGKAFQFVKPDVWHKEILAPEGGEPWVFEREELWNRVERAEMNKDGTLRENAQTYREFEISIPRELTRAQQLALVRAFVRDHLVGLGMVADIALHERRASDGLAQPHAHILCPMRRLDPSRASGFAKAKEREWDEIEAIKTPWNNARKLFANMEAAVEDGRPTAFDPANKIEVPASLEALADAKANLEHWEAERRVNLWRKAWADYANAALEEASSPARIDHRTLEKQGIARLAEKALGWARHVDIPRQIEKGYQFLRERLTNWTAIRGRNLLQREADQMRARGSVDHTSLVLHLSELAEDLVDRYRRREPVPDIPMEEGSYER